MDTWIKLLEAASPLITTVIGAGGTVQFLLSRYDKKHMEEKRAAAERRALADAERKCLRDLTCAMAQDRIVYLCDKAIEDGQIELDMKEIIEDIGKPYEGLGWNNHAHARLEAMRKLPEVVRKEH